MGEVIKGDFSDNSAFQEEMNDIIDDFISCLGSGIGIDGPVISGNPLSNTLGNNPFTSPSTLSIIFFWN